jgi:hypothetical protein
VSKGNNLIAAIHNLKVKRKLAPAGKYVQASALHQGEELLAACDRPYGSRVIVNTYTGKYVRLRGSWDLAGRHRQ